MEDIIPAVKKRGEKKTKPRQENVLRIEYKLPARLRRPIRAHVGHAKREKVKKNNAVGFEHRSIRTEVPSNRPPSYKKNVGVEHHTGDIYMKARPETTVISPPYVSRRVMSGMVFEQKQRRLDKSRIESRQAKPRMPEGNRSKQAIVTTKRQERKKTIGIAEKGIRDTPYQFGINEKKDQARMAQDYSVATNLKGRLEERPVLEILQPGTSLVSARGGIKDFGGKIVGLFSFYTSKQVAFNVGVLLVGCIVLYGVVWNLTGLGKGLQVMGSVQERVDGAYSRFISASVAMAETDFESSESNFADAATLISEARSELDEAMSASQSVLRYVDLTGTVRSGQELLSVGEDLSRAGESIARGADLLLSNFGDKSFVEAVGVASEEFRTSIAALDEAEGSLDNVQSVFLPEEIQAEVATLKSVVPKLRLVLTGFTERSDVLLALLGAKRDQQYLLLFQNNHEMRATGGFIGSIGLVNIDRGAVEEVDISSVYDPDGQMREFIEPPEPLKAVTNRWYMRDANWFIDFPTSARKVMQMFEKEGGPTVDGVIALTPEVIRELLRITGPINVPAYGVRVDYDNFWRITQDQVSYSYDKELNRPKQFLADMAPLLLNKLFEAKEASSLEALSGLISMIEQKHLLVYLHDEELQNKLSGIGWSGEIPKDKKGLLAVNNVNIAGHKSDQFIEQKIDYRLEMMQDGSVEAVVMIRREHRGDIEQSDYLYPKDENPALKDNIVYQRVLVPLGAKLLGAEGFSARADVPQMVIPESFENMRADSDLVEWQTGQIKHETGTTIGEETGYTFFANWMITKPGQTSVALYRYRLPKQDIWPSIIDPVKSLEAYVIKQPGDSRSKIRVELKLPDNMNIIHTVPGAGTTQESNVSLVYRSELIRDMLVGAVFERRGG